MNRILGINVNTSQVEESLTGCDPLETLADDRALANEFDGKESGRETQIDRLSDALPPNRTILAESPIDSEDLSASGQEADNSTEIDRFITDLPSETETDRTPLESALFDL